MKLPHTLNRYHMKLDTVLWCLALLQKGERGACSSVSTPLLLSLGWDVLQDAVAWLQAG